ncbi:MAG: hypothetical protein ABIT16_02405 [Croceibacterium sp.]
MKKWTIVCAVAAAGFALPALAQGGLPPDPYGDATVTKAAAEAQATERFGQLDTNHDGSLTPEERTAGGGFGGRGPGATAAMTKDDYVAGQMRRFDTQDGDHDGQLTKAERDAFRQQMIQRFQNGGGQ